MYFYCFETVLIVFTPPLHVVLDLNTVERTVPDQSPTYWEMPPGISVSWYRCTKVKEVHRAKWDWMFLTQVGTWRNGHSPDWMDACVCTATTVASDRRVNVLLHQTSQMWRRGEGFNLLFPVNLCLPRKKTDPYVLPLPSRASERCNTYL